MNLKQTNKEVNPTFIGDLLTIDCLLIMLEHQFRVVSFAFVTVTYLSYLQTYASSFVIEGALLRGDI